MSADEVAKLRAEIADLSLKLANAEAETARAGELGLIVYNDKTAIEQQLAEQQRLYELLKEELEHAREHKHAATAELDEARFYEDRAELEEKYEKRVKQLEEDVKKLQLELEHSRADLDKVQNEHTAAVQKIEELSEQRTNLKEELKELKSREQRLLNENNDLEDENVNLQKQVSTLKAAQVEYEGLKLEVTRIMDDNESLQNLVTEAKHFQAMAERQTEDALQTAQHEREQRLALKREIEQMRNNEQISSLNNLYMSFSAAKADNDESKIHELESSIISDAPLGSTPHTGSDLFSEIHGNEINKLKEDNEKLRSEISDLQSGVNRALGPLLQKLQIAGLGDAADLKRFKEAVQEAIGRLDEKLKAGTPDKTSERKIEQLKADLRHIILLAGAKNAQLAVAQDRILHFSQNQAQFFEEATAAAGVDEEHKKKTAAIQHLIRELAQHNSEAEEKEGEAEDAERDAKSPKLPAVNVSRSLLPKTFAQEIASKLQSGVTLEEIIAESDRREKLASENEAVLKSFEALQEMTKLGNQATENILQAKMLMEDQDKAELLQQNHKLKSLLAVKREQVSSLRTVLRSNKTCNENALQSLRSKYESEKKIKDETIVQLRKELKQFREDAATFASNRAMQAARIEELQAENERQRGQITTVEEEKRTLNQLLHMSVQQKLTATQRLEELEIDRERQTYKRPIRPPPSQQQREVRAVRYPQSGAGQGGAQTSPRQK